ncbi:hypothetical protein VUR80DRAFT_1304 [Thermomyces stellatus]
MSRTTVELIPWDHESREHRDRLIDQRIACGWHSDKVQGEWKDEQRAGAKCIYWLAIPKDNPNYESCVKTHNASYPKQASPLVDTAISVRGTDRNPTHQSFHPVGHVSLDMRFPAAESLDLDLPETGAIWIKTLYVSNALQSSGIGRAAMDAVEAMATEEPICARTLMLDTVCKEDQMREDFARGFYGYVPKIANEDWYGRRGYRIVARVPGFYKEVDQGKWKITTVFMRMDLA